MKLHALKSGPFRVPTLPHPQRNRRVYDRRWMRAWLLPIPVIRA